MTTEKITAQLERELGEAVFRVAVLADEDALMHWEGTIRERCGWLADRIVEHDLDVTISVMKALWPHTRPEDTNPSWWRSPLGRAVAAVDAGDIPIRDDGAVKQTVAADMLGLVRGSVATMVHRGTLEKGPAGGVLRRSIFRRLADAERSS